MYNSTKDIAIWKCSLQTFISYFIRKSLQSSGETEQKQGWETLHILSIISRGWIMSPKYSCPPRTAECDLIRI